jgi:crossover junction endodeoxyribonuclease RuvC
MRVISVDPGYERLGVAILDKEQRGKEQLVYSDCITTLKTLPHAERLGQLGAELDRLIEEYKPEALAIETLFFSKSVTSALKVAEARGVILHAAARKSVKVYEFSPMEIKIAVTGHGKSDKKQVISMVEKLIKISKKIKYDDEFDAIACGLTFFAHYRYPQLG